MKGKHAAQAQRKKIETLEISLSRTEGELVTERNKRIEAERSLREQAKTKEELARLRQQTEKQVSDKYLALEAKYTRALDIIKETKRVEKINEDTIGDLIGLYADAAGITRTEAMDDMFTKRMGDEGEEPLLVLHETNPEAGTTSKKGKRLVSIMERFRRRRYEAKQKARFF